VKARLDVLLMVVITGAIVVLFAAIADRDFSRPLPARPAPLPAPTPALLPTVTPEPSPTGGWWDAVSMTPAALPALPGVPAPGTGGLGVGGASGGEDVAFSVAACPQPTVKITKIVTAKPPWWNVYGTAAIPNLEYWKAELSADGQGWALLYRSAAAVADGLLIEFNTRTVPKGTYQLRLLAVDRTGNYGEPCTVSITIR
jgi:hypothetical protein